jgi:predicted GNAT family acetyltransferase
MVPDIKHNVDEHRFETTIDAHVAELTYRLDGNRIILLHTGVPAEFRGKGIGAALVKAGLDYAAEHGLQVVPRCPFVASYIDKHPEYRPLLTPR